MNPRRFVYILLLAGAAAIFAAYMVQKQQTQPKPTSTSTSSPTSTSAPVPTVAATADKPAAKPTSPVVNSKWAEWVKDSSSAPMEKFAIGSLDPKNEYKFQLECANQGAAIYTVKLADYFQTVKDKQLFSKNSQAYEDAIRKDPTMRDGHYSLMNPVVGPDGKVFLPLTSAKISVFTGEDQKTPLVSIGMDDRAWRRVVSDSTAGKAESESITYEWNLYHNPNRDDPNVVAPKKFLTVQKTYTVRKKDYSIAISLKIINHSDRQIFVTVDQYGPTGVPRDDDQGADPRKFVYSRLIDNVTFEPKFDDVSTLQKLTPEQRHDVGTSNEAEPIVWMGQVSKFFATILYVKPADKDRLVASQVKAQYRYQAISESSTSKVHLADTVFDMLPIPASANYQVDFDLYAGPKDREIMKGEAPDSQVVKASQDLYKKLHYVETIELGSWCSFSGLALAMMWLLKAFSVIAGGNYGVAIILLVLLVRLLLHPLSRYSQISMSKMQKKMAALQPQMQRLKEKYKDDKAALNQEMMKLYRESGTGATSGILGCLPMVLQMPIWIALWTGVNASVELRHAAFLPVWITDLAAPDALFSWQANIPLIGTSLNLLPLLLTVAMFLQMKYTPQMSAAVQTPEQASQQKMMQFMMPVMMLFIFYNMPSGLNLYIMASTFIGLVEQYYIRKHIKARDDAAAASETVIDMPGKGMRGSRPKKSKGPLWFKKN